jgi:TnpA family transposase
MSQNKSEKGKKRPRGMSLPADPTDDELAREWTLSADDLAQVQQCRGDSNRIRFSIQLCVLRKHGRFLENYSHVTPRILNHFCRQLEISPLLKLDESERNATEYGYQKRIREYLHYCDFDDRVERELMDWLAERALEGVLSQELFDRAEQVLKAWHVILPAPSSIERMVSTVAAHAQEEFYEKIANRLSTKFKKQLDALLKTAMAGDKSDLFRLKEYPQKPSAKQIVSYIERFEQVDSILGDVEDSGINAAMQRHLFNLAKQHNVYSLRRMDNNQKYALTFCFLIEIRKTLLDYLVAMHDKYISELLRTCKNKHDKKLKEYRKRSKVGLSIILEASEIVLDASIEESLRVGAIFKQVGERNLRDSVDDCRDLLHLEERGFVDQLCNHYNPFQRYFSRFLSLNLESSAGSEKLMEQINLCRQVNAEQTKFPSDPAHFFIPTDWKWAAYKSDDSMDRRVWEIALAVAIRDALRSGDLFLARSRKHVSFWNLVYDDEQWESQKQSAYAALALPSEIDTVIENLREEFKTVFSKLKTGLENNPFATVDDGDIKLKQPDELMIPDSAQALRHAIETLMPPIKIENLLQDVDSKCHFTSEFRPLGGYKPRAENLYLTVLANQIAHTTNLGITGMANSVDGLTADMLQHVNQWFFTDETQRAANAVLVNFHHRLPLSTLYGTGELSSSDGQRFGIERSSLLASVYPRYFGYYDRAVTIYTHISDQFSIFSTQAISCAPREAMYVLDGLLNNNTQLQPKEHTTDTHGYTEILFALCYLLGYSFVPRLKDLPDQVLYRIDRSIDVGDLKSMFSGYIDLELIREQWDELVRVAASLKNKVAPAHVVLQRLTNASPQDRVAKAVTALGRIVKTIFILKYISDPILRSRIQRQLNRGESRHDLAQHLCFSDQGEFKTGDYDEIMNKASCLSLSCNAVLVWNTMEIAKIVRALRISGESVSDADVLTVSPLIRGHVVPNGTYFSHFSKAPHSIMILPG